MNTLELKVLDSTELEVATTIPNELIKKAVSSTLLISNSQIDNPKSLDPDIFSDQPRNGLSLFPGTIANTEDLAKVMA